MRIKKNLDEVVDFTENEKVNYALFEVPSITIRQLERIRWWRKVGFYTGGEMPIELTE